MATWFVTGASRGIGAEIARAALAGGNNVVVAVRNPERVPDDLKKSDNVFAVALDVTDNDSIPRAVEAAVKRFGGIDVLVNNAGRGLLGALEEITDAEARSLFDLNVFGLINVTRAVLPVMREQGSGKLVHIGSRSGFEGEPGVSLYSASKFAVAGISEALSAEMAPFGIQSMVVEPGVFRTDFLDHSSLSVAANRIADYDDTPAHVTLDWIDRANHAQRGAHRRGHRHREAAHASLPRPRHPGAAGGQVPAGAGRPGPVAREVRGHRARRRRLTRHRAPEPDSESGRPRRPPSDMPDTSDAPDAPDAPSNIFPIRVIEVL